MSADFYFFSFVCACLIFIWLYYCYYNAESFQLKCIVTDSSGDKKFCVRERKNMKQAAGLLEKIANKCQLVVDTLYEKYPDDERYVRLKKMYNNEKLTELLPTNILTALTVNKGEKMSFCLNKRKTDDSTLIDFDTLFFVSLHELSHIATKETGHPDIFWENFKDLQVKAKAAGLYTPVDYKKNNQLFCSMPITNNPYFDL